MNVKPQNIIDKLHTRLYSYFYDQVTKRHLKRTGTDIKCPSCNEWFSVSGVKYKHKKRFYDPVNMNELSYYVCSCGQCGHESKWTGDLAPFLVLLQDDGTVKNEN